MKKDFRFSLLLDSKARHDSRYIFEGILFEGILFEDESVAVATDGRRLAYVKDRVAAGLPALLPAGIYGDDWNLMKGEYPKWREIIPDPGQMKWIPIAGISQNIVAKRQVQLCFLESSDEMKPYMALGIHGNDPKFLFSIDLNLIQLASTQNSWLGFTTHSSETLIVPMEKGSMEVQRGVCRSLTKENLFDLDWFSIVMPMKAKEK